MKKIIYGLLFLAIACSCQKSIENINNVDEIEQFIAEIETISGKTKTAMDDNNNIVWTESDQLAIFQGYNIADRYQVTKESVGTGNGNFTLISDNSGNVNDSFSSGLEIDGNIALYPYVENLSIKKISSGNEDAAYQISGYVLPSVQNYATNSFGKDSFPMVAVTKTISDHKLKFRNILGAIKLQIKGDAIIKSIVIEGKNGEILSGAATITAYMDETKPTIALTSNASEFVTLDCGTGVRLNENISTEFIIALPPVSFSNGFSITITDYNSKTFTIETDKVNSVLRSSVLVMPEIKLEDPDVDGSEDDELYIPVISMNLYPSKVELYLHETEQLTATVMPRDATDDVSWSSDNPSIAIVDQSGLVTAISDGKCNIIAEAGDIEVSCTVTVFAAEQIDYIDEYGINHGEGVNIRNTIWAPVNCGYHESDFKFGKLYQWGRKYGQGYGNENGTDNSDAILPTIEPGGVSVLGGNHKNNANIFYKGAGHDWLYQHDQTLWNSGDERNPIKTDYDPCPAGWRVPTYLELEELSKYDVWVAKLCGRMFWEKVFLPAAGYRYADGAASSRGSLGIYWTSKPNTGGYDDRAYNLRIGQSVCELDFDSRAYGCYVRCVQE